MFPRELFWGTGGGYPPPTGRGITLSVSLPVSNLTAWFSMGWGVMTSGLGTPERPLALLKQPSGPGFGWTA